MRSICRHLIAVFSFITILLAPAFAFDAAESSNRLGIELLQKISAEESGNLLLSPYSLSSVLAPLYVGSAGETRDELGRALHFPSDNAQVELAFAANRIRLRTADTITIESANRLFIQQGFPVRDAFNKQMRDSFDFEPQSLDFKSDAIKSANIINDWVSRQTRGKIDSAVSSLDPDTRLILVNASYLRADWKDPFKPEQTFPRPFHVNGSKETSNRPAMHRTAHLGYAREDGFQIISLPYTDPNYHCLIILPDQVDGSTNALNHLTTDHLKRWARLARRNDTLVELQLPPFTFANTARSLVAPLKRLGIRQAFDEPSGSANFDPISARTPDNYLAVSDIVQSTFIAVDEEGTEAAASTAVELVSFGVAAGPRIKPVEMHVNRPFLFAIQNVRTSTCLFLGRIVDPLR